LCSDPPILIVMGPIGLYETSVRNYHYSLRNDPEERSSQTNSCSDIRQMSRFLWNVIRHDLNFDNPIGRTVAVVAVYSKLRGVWYSTKVNRVLACLLKVCQLV
jgi:hypothetical protein